MQQQRRSKSNTNIAPLLSASSPYLQIVDALPSERKLVVRFPKAPTADNPEPYVDITYQVGLQQHSHCWPDATKSGDCRRQLQAAAAGSPRCSSPAPPPPLNPHIHTPITHTHTYLPAQGQELGQLELAYAITVHKAQGGEAKHVVLALSQSHGRMLSRRLLYTGAGGAGRVVLAGPGRARPGWVRLRPMGQWGH